MIVIPHPSFGQQLFAVLASLDDVDKEDVKRQALNSLGKDYALGGIVSLKEIGMAAFPVNDTHKVVKFEVQTALLEYLSTGPF